MDASTFKVRGLDCAEEAAQLKGALRPLLTSDDSLSFDLLNAKMTVRKEDGKPRDEQIVRAVAVTGMTAIPWDEWTRSMASPHAQGWRRRLRELFCAASGAGTAAGFILHGLGAGWAAAITGGEAAETGYPAASAAAYAFAIVTGAWFFAPRAYFSLRRLSPDIYLLVTAAIAGAVLLGNWFEAAMVSYLFAFALLLEAWSVGHARRAIGALLDTAPVMARYLCASCCAEDAAPTVKEGPVEEIPLGATVLVRPGERVPLDGVVRKGATSMNQAPLTGESAPVAKQVGDEVFAGTLNNEGAIEFEVTRRADDTALARVIRMVDEAQSRRAPAEQWVERFARVYTPAMMGVALLVAVGPPVVWGGSWTYWFYQSLIVLLIACPCALVISTPVSIVAGLARAARAGVLIKGGAYLEAPARLRAIALDKTGTLTFGEPEVQDVAPLNGHARRELLAEAASAEAMSAHPLAQAIVRRALEENLELTKGESYESLTGRGAVAQVKGRKLWIGSERLMREQGLLAPEHAAAVERLEDAGHSVILVGSEAHRHVCGIISFSARLRPEAATVVAALKRAGIEHVAMLTGDNAGTARAIAEATGVDSFQAQLLPDEKVNAIEQLVAEFGRVAMVGDGVNDAPAMAASSVGIVMGAAGSDAAIETADIALMADDLGRIPWVIEHSRRTLRIIKQNIAVALGFKAGFLALAAAGWATLWLAIVADMGASLLVIFNGLRLLRTPD